VFAGGGRWLSLREKAMNPDERLALLRRLAAIAARWGATVGVHDDVAAAAAVPGTALHLPAGSSVAAARATLGPRRLIGRSAHAGDVLRGADVGGLDYQTISPVFLTGSKPGYGPAIGLKGIAQAVSTAATPIIGLGGIATGDVGPCLAAGASGIAVMGAVMAALDPQAVVIALLRHFGGSSAASTA
jgi:thiamine-phosphate pyrophosphorylase